MNQNLASRASGRFEDLKDLTHWKQSNVLFVVAGLPDVTWNI